MELKLTAHELDYLRQIIEGNLERANETDYNEKHQDMINNLYSKLVVMDVLEKKLKKDIKYQLEEFELGGIDVWELIKRIETIVNK